LHSEANQEVGNFHLRPRRRTAPRRKRRRLAISRSGTESLRRPFGAS
jgi:hypothetical protein